VSEHPLYGDRAELYDLIYAWKDYAAEAERLVGVLGDLGVAPGARVLEAACGTGAFLGPLAGRYRVTGFDRSEAMLAIARRKLPDVPVFVGDLETFEVEEPHDAVLCLFSSIGYLSDDAALRRAALRFARALRPGGAVVIEPWIERDDFVDGMAHLQTYDGEDRKIARASVSSVRGEYAVVAFRWLVVGPGGPIESFDEIHELRFVPHRRIVEIFADAGIRLRSRAEGLLPNRGLLVGNRT
jgi:daunosaminyl-N,N-dimethyltransferase/N-dimethyltransferase